MLFLKKKKSARERNVERLLLLLEKAKTEWINIRDLYEKSVDPSDELRYELQLAKSKYIFLMREAKNSKLRTKR